MKFPTPISKTLLKPPQFTLNPNKPSQFAHFHTDSPIPKPDSFAHHFKLHKPKGQHILTNPRVLDSIVRLADVSKEDSVLEVGPGTGNLTVRLLAAARHVAAVEIDERMVRVLKERVERVGLLHKLTIIKGDAIKSEFPHFDTCVANIPYQISSPLIAKLLFGPYRFRTATLLLQKEFAQRLTAVPGDSQYNRMACNVNIAASVKKLMDVSKRDFVPVPKVDSSLVRISPKENGLNQVDLKEWLGFTRVCFCKKNKTLGAIFKQKRMVLELFERSRAERENWGCSEIESFEDFEESEERESGGEEREREGVDLCELGEYKERIVRVLEKRGFGEKRPSKLSNEELVCLLGFFNQEGVFFR